jgi:hypothetical protein
MWFEKERDFLILFNFLFFSLLLDPTHFIYENRMLIADNRAGEEEQKKRGEKSVQLQLAGQLIYNCAHNCIKREIQHKFMLFFLLCKTTAAAKENAKCR